MRASIGVVQEKPLTLVPRTGGAVPMPRAPRRERVGQLALDPWKELAHQREHLAACFDEIRALRLELAQQRVWRIERESVDSGERFEALRRCWREDVAGLSDLREIVAHPAYEAIIAMGAEVVPWLLRDVARGAGHWHVALRAITGEQPVPASEVGRLQSIRDHWLAWGRVRKLVE